MLWLELCSVQGSDYYWDVAVVKLGGHGFQASVMMVVVRCFMLYAAFSLSYLFRRVVGVTDEANSLLPFYNCLEKSSS